VAAHSLDRSPTRKKIYPQANRHQGDSRGSLQMDGSHCSGLSFEPRSHGARRSDAIALALLNILSGRIPGSSTTADPAAAPPCRCAPCSDRAGNFTSCNSRRNPELFPLLSRPLRFDLDHPFVARKIVPEAPPGPLLRTGNQSSAHAVATNVPQLLDPLLFAPHAEIVIAPARTSRLPVRTVDALRSALASELRVKASLRLSHQQVNGALA
jgi:hypothetical protein